MRRSQLIEWGIIAIGIIFGFKFFEGMFTLVFQIIGRLSFPGMGLNLLTYALVPIIYFLGFWLIIRNSRNIAYKLSAQTGDELVPLKINKHSLLQVVIIAICIVSFFSAIAEIILYAIDLFRKDVGNRGMTAYESLSNSDFQFKLGLVRVIISVVVLYFSKDISGWFIRRDEVEELTFDSKQ